jgi:hypothetical protein
MPLAKACPQTRKAQVAGRSVALETVHERAEVATVTHATRTLLRRYGVALWRQFAHR